MDYTLRNIDPELWKQVKARAAIKGISIKQLIIQKLTKEIEKYEQETNKPNNSQCLEAESTKKDES